MPDFVTLQTNVPKLPQLLEKKLVRRFYTQTPEKETLILMKKSSVAGNVYLDKFALSSGGKKIYNTNTFSRKKCMYVTVSA